jgi:biotin carboxylase
MKSCYVVVVDGFSTGRFLAPEYRARNARVLHVLSRSTVPAMLQSAFDASQYEASFSRDELSVEGLVERLRPYEPRAVVAGCETGVELADRLASALAAPGNNPASSALRRNKFEMIEALRSAGLRAARQVVVREPPEVESAVQEWPDDLFPAVVKPLESTGTDGVCFVSSPSDAARAISSLLGARNQLGETNHGVLLQERLVGREYVVNAVSFQGQAQITEVWRLSKRPVDRGSFIYDYDELIGDDEPEVPGLIAYVEQCILALGIEIGPSHSEVMLTPSGPTLIECGARVQGSADPYFLQECQGVSQLHDWVELSLSPRLATWSRIARRRRRLEKTARWVQLIVDEPGRTRAIGFSDQIRQLPTFYDGHIDIADGVELPKTIDLFSSPGDVFLCGNTPEEVERDYRRIRELEREWVASRDPLGPAAPAARSAA